MAAAKGKTVKLQKLRLEDIPVRIEGTTPYIAHSMRGMGDPYFRPWDFPPKSKAEKMKRDPDQEVEDSKYFTSDGQDGIPKAAFLRALESMANNDFGIPRVMIPKAISIVCDDIKGVLPLTYDSCVVNETTVRIGGKGKGNGTPAMRWRPAYVGWKVTLHIRINLLLISVEDTLNLLENAGYSIGVGDERPEKGGDFGRFRLVGEAA